MTKIPKNKIPISVSFPLDMLPEIDDYAYYKNQTRSSYIVEATKEKMERDKEKKDRKND